MSTDEQTEKKKKTALWKVRGVSAGLPLFQNPAKLWAAACDYFQFVDDNPFVEMKLVKHKDTSALEEIPKIKPYTLSGLCFYLGCSEAYFRKFKRSILQRNTSATSKDADNAFAETIEAIEQVIETQQLEGAMLGEFNYNIVRAKLGLVDKQDVTSNGETILQVNVQKAKDLKNMEALK